jgi:hypothetical protein
MKRYKTFAVVLLFLIAFAFTLTYALSGPPPIHPGDDPAACPCCIIPASGGCSAGSGVWYKYLNKCVCNPDRNPNGCPLVCPECY